MKGLAPPLARGPLPSRSATGAVRIRWLLLLLCVARASSQPFVGGPGHCLFFNKPTQFAMMYPTPSSPDGSYVISGFPTKAVTIEYWLRYIYDANSPSRRYVHFSLASNDVYSASGVRTYDDNSIQCCPNIDNTQFVYLLASLSGGRPISTPPSANYGPDYKKWHHYAIVFEPMANATAPPAAIRVYIDGILAMDGTYPEIGNATLPSTGAFMLAQDQDSIAGSIDDQQSFIGMFDELRIWSVARTQSEIQRDFGRELVGNETGLWVYYPFNEGSGDMAYNKVDPSRHVLRLGTGAAFQATPEQRPVWSISHAPVWGPNPLRALANRGSVTRVDFSPHAMPANVTLVSTTCSGVVDFFGDADGTHALAATDALPPNAPSAYMRIAGAAPTPLPACNVTFNIAAAGRSGTQTLVLSENMPPVVANVSVTFVEDSLGRLALTGSDSEIIAAVIVSSVPRNGTLYAMALDWSQLFTFSANGLTSTVPGGPVAYSPASNQFGEGFDVLRFRVVDESGGISGEGTVTIDVTPVDDRPVAGRNPYYLEFAHEGQLVRTAAISPPSTQDFAVSFFLRMSTLPATNATLFSVPSRVAGLVAPYTLCVTHAGRIQFLVSGTIAVDGNATLSFGDKWSHVAVSMQGTRAALFVDGALVANGTAPSRPSVGAGVDVGGFKGSLDEFSVYNKSLTADDIAAIRAIKCAPLGSRLVACFPFDEGVGGFTRCAAPSCSATAQLGDGSVSSAPLWTLLPVVIAPSFASYPQFETVLTTEETAVVVSLPAIDVDTDARAFAYVVMDLPKGGKLYQYDDSAPDKRGAPIDLPYLYWRYTIEPTTVWPFTAYKPPWNLSCCATEAEFFTLVNAVADKPCRLCQREDPYLRMSTQFSYAVYGTFDLLDNPGHPARYNPYAPPGYGYGDSIFAYTPQSVGEALSANGERDCVHAPPGLPLQNPFAWTCPTGKENEFFEVGLSEPLFVQSVAVYENYYPGAVVNIKARVNGTANEWVDLWSGGPRTELYDAKGNYVDQKYVVFEPPVCNTAFLADALHVELATHLVPGWNEVESVSLTGTRTLKDGVVLD
eukprot:Opistho-1_new@68443